MPPLEQEVLAVVRRMFRTELEYGGPVEVDLDLLRDLHVDSLNAVVLAVGLEDHFRVRLETEDTVGVTTVGDLVARVAERVRVTQDGGTETTA